MKNYLLLCVNKFFFETRLKDTRKDKSFEMIGQKGYLIYLQLIIDIKKNMYIILNIKVTIVDIQTEKKKEKKNANELVAQSDIKK